MASGHGLLLRGTQFCGLHELMIAKDQLKVRGIYKVEARNIGLAVWNGKDFVGIRHKFGHRYLDEERPYEDGPPYGTASAVAEVGTLPETIPLETRGRTVCHNCGTPAKWLGPPAPAPWVCEGGCVKVDPVSRDNQAMFDYLEAFHDQV